MKHKMSLFFALFFTCGLFADGVSARRKRGRRHHLGLGFHRLVKELNLKPAQMKKIKAIRYKHQRQMIRLRADIQLARLDLRQMVQQHKPNLQKVEAQIEKVGKLEVQAKKIRILMMLKMKAVLTPQQAEQAKELRRKHRRRWRQRWRGRRWRGRRWGKHRPQGEMQPKNDGEPKAPPKQ